MLLPSPSLADALASLRRTAEADDAQGWLPAALHVLIMASLARLLARLEQMVLLWQSGELPPPAIRPTRRFAEPHPPRAATQRQRTARPRPRARRPEPPAAHPQASPARQAPSLLANILPRTNRSIARAKVPTRKSGVRAIPPTHALIITITK